MVSLWKTEIGRLLLSLGRRSLLDHRPYDQSHQSNAVAENGREIWIQCDRCRCRRGEETLGQCTSLPLSDLRRSGLVSLRLSQCN